LDYPSNHPHKKRSATVFCGQTKQHYTRNLEFDQPKQLIFLPGILALGKDVVRFMHAMVTPLLATKLHIPSPRPNLVSRPRLIKRLNDGLRLGHRLTLVSAPAGFGKTTLLSEWCASPDHPTAWFSLDKTDGDLLRFTTYMVAALQALPGGSDMAVSLRDDLLTNLLSQPLPLEERMSLLINEIARIPHDFTLVLDDYHLIDSQNIHDGLAFFLDRQPPQMHLVIASRAEPPLPVARLRARGQLTELGADDLRFTPNEAAAFLERVMGLNLSPEDVTRLEARTEGWIAGLQMAALSAQKRNDISAFITAFAGDDRYITDYLIEEILSQQPETVQTFLTETSILKRLNGSLCDATTGGSNGQETLEILERNNLFIVPLDHRREWYRYHHLFAELLRHHLRQQVSQKALAALHLRAADWYESNGLPAEAIEHTLQAQDFDQAARLIEEQSEPLLLRGEADTLMSWLAALPVDLVRSRPFLNTTKAWALLIKAQFDQVETCIQAAETALATDAEAQASTERTTQGIRGNITAIQAVVAGNLGDDSRAIELSRQALDLIEKDGLLYSTLLMNLGEAYARSGNVDAARCVFSEAIAAGKEIENVVPTLVAMGGLGWLHMYTGDLHKAAEIGKQAVQFGIEKGERERPVPATGTSYMLLSQYHYQWNDLDAALFYANEAIECCKRWEHFENLMDSYLLLANAQNARGDAAGVDQTTASLQHLIESTQGRAGRALSSAVERAIHRLEALQASIWLSRGKADAATQWLARQTKERHLLDDDPLPYLIRPRLLMAQGKHDEAKRLMESALAWAETHHRIDIVIHRLAMLACVQYEAGDAKQALSTLERALQLAEPGGYIRAFVDLGRPMATLLRQAAARGLAPDYVNTLLEAFRARAQDLPHIHTPTLAEPLSDRELEILRLIAAGLSNQEIADTLVVSVNTVKTHVRRLYGKLSVNNRLQAVERARELDLL
jgi:LuxR family maltose regulon positive regulatory protein